MGSAAPPKPYPHQVKGVEELQAHATWGHLWDMGTGKTKAQIDDLLLRKRRGERMGGIVFTPNRNKGNWAVQVPYHSGGELTVSVPGEHGSSGHTKRSEFIDGNADVYVLNPETLVYMSDLFRKKEWPFIIVDESTTIKNPQAMRTKTLFSMKSPLRRIMTGLPNPNSPLDLYTQFSFLDPMIFGGNYWRFRDRYAIMGRGAGQHMVVGYHHLEDLYAAIRPYHSIVDESVLGLPPRVYLDMDIPLGGKTLKHYEDMRKELRTWWGNGDELKARLALTQLLRLSQIAGGLLQSGDRYEWIKDNPKAQALDEILAEVLTPIKEKAVVFCIYQKEIEALQDRYKDRYKPLVIYGGISERDSTSAWRSFQEPGNSNRLMIAQSHSGGLGIDLYAARTAIYYTRDFSLEAYKQSQKRLHRLGQTGTVRIINLLSSLPSGTTSIDAVISRSLARKSKLAAGLMTKAFSTAEIMATVREVLS